MIPDYHILDAFFAFADENKEGKYTPSYYNCPNLTILYIFQIKKKKKKKTRIVTSLSIFSKEKKAAQYEFVSVTWENIHTFWKEIKHKQIVKCMVICHGIIILLLLSLILLL